MKKYLVISFGLVLAFLSFNSCEDDIQIIGEYKQTAVIYGLLDQSESTHFIKINRAFIGPGNAIEIAAIPDSNYFESVDATVSEIIDGDTTRVWVLEDTLIDTKDTNGIFYAPTEKVYYFKDGSLGALNATATYILNAVLNKGMSNEFTVSGQTGLVSGVTSGQSNVSNSFAFVASDGTLKSTNIIVSNTGNASIINASLGIDFYEFSGGNILDSVSINWNTGEEEVQPQGSFSTAIQGEYFYNLIKQNVTSNTAIDKRRMKSMTIKITAGTEELKDYINTHKPSSSLAQSKPNYTNLQASNGQYVVGIFSARQTIKIVKVFSQPFQNYSCLDSKSRKELCTGSITGDLLFCSDLNLDAIQSYYCP